MNVRSKEYYINDDNKLKKRLFKRSLYVQSLRTPVVDKNIDIIGEQIDSGNVPIPRQIQPRQLQQVSNYSSSGGDTKGLVNIINALTTQISHISLMFIPSKFQNGITSNAIKNTVNVTDVLILPQNFADNYIMAISKVKFLFNELRDTFDSYLKTVNPNKKEQFQEITNTIIKYFEVWNPFFKSLDVSIVLNDGKETVVPINEYVYNNVNSGDIQYKLALDNAGNIIPNTPFRSNIALYVASIFTKTYIITNTFVEINYNYNDILKIIYDTLGTFVDKIKTEKPKENIKNPKDIDAHIKLLIKERDDKTAEIKDLQDNTIDPLAIEVAKLRQEIHDKEIEIQDWKQKIEDAIVDIVKIFNNNSSDEKTAKEYFNLNLKNPITVDEQTRIDQINQIITHIGQGAVRIEFIKINNAKMQIEGFELDKNKLTTSFKTKREKLNKAIIKKSKLERELDDILKQIQAEEDYKQTKFSKIDYTPKKGSGRGRGQSIKHIPKKGSGRSQYVDPYDRSIPKRYM